MPIKHRIVSPTIALFLEDGRHVAHTVPTGSIITTDDRPFDGNKLVKVHWNGREGMMFAQDLQSRGQMVE